MNEERSDALEKRAPAARPAVGRPRDGGRHEAVLAATRELLREHGYSRLTIDGIAERAQVSRTLIYRWWANKGELVQEALFPLQRSRRTPDTGSFAGDLRVLVEYNVESFSRLEMVRGLPGLHADLAADGELRRKVRRGFAEPALERWMAVFRRATERGEIAASVDPTLAFESCSGLVMRLTQDRTRRRGDLVDYVTSLLLHGVRGPQAIERRAGPV